MKNITYLLGAGASANTIPIVNNMRYRFKDVVNFLSIHLKDKNNITAYSSLDRNIQTYNNYLNNIIEDLDWLESEALQFQTIDTLAKQYYLTNNENLKRLKKTLIIYFTIEQLLSIKANTRENYVFVKSKELRYESFFASVINKIDNTRIEVNPNIKILSWNYDQQLELALKTFTKKSISSINTEFQIVPNENNYEKPNIDLEFDFSKFGCVKLNGTAKWDKLISSSPDIPISTFEYYHESKDTQYILGLVLKEYDTIKNYRYGQHLRNSLLYFNFSWESDNNYHEKYSSYYLNKKIAVDIARNTNILVIIGYSFPVFNRKTDKEIIDNMGDLEKVYIQNPNCDNIKSTLINGFSIFQTPNRKRTIQFELEKNTDQFLIPYEL